MPVPAARAVATLACVLLPFAIVSGWLAAFVTNTDRYVATVAPLAEDPVVTDAMVQKLETAIIDSIDFEKQRASLNDFLDQQDAGPVIRRGAYALADLAEEAVQQAIHRVVVRIVQGPGFAEAWDAANRSAHELLVGVLSGEINPPTDDSGLVSIQVAAVVNQIVAALQDKGLISETQAIPEVQSSFQIMKTSDLEKARSYYQLLDKLGYWLPIVWLLLVIATVVFAPDRRRALTWLSYGTAGVVLLLAVALILVRNRLESAAEDPEVLRSIWQILIANLRDLLRTLLLVSLAVFAGLWVTGTSRQAEWTRDKVRAGTTLVQERVDPGLLRLGGIALLVVVALIWIL
jgi:hypothetical protein